jgi:hypothetical protein
VHMEWLRRLFGGFAERTASHSTVSSPRRITARHPLIIQSPRIGFLNLLGAPAELILAEDKRALGPLFASVQESEADPPTCAVLMIYARLQGDGRIAGCSDGLRDIIRKANSPIAIVASENDVNGCIAASKRTAYGQANLVMTLERKGANFSKFFVQLFSEMSGGTSMPMAWVRLAPQGSKTGHENLPETVFTAEVSHIIFK